jgi:energy-coupling factor transport system ATP-binding protein
LASTQSTSRPDPAVLVEDLSFRYSGGTEPVLRKVNLDIPQGALVLLVGATGAGKSTLYMTLNGLIPHMVRGRMAGRVRVAGMDTLEHSIPELAQRVGIVFQDPEVQLFALTVEEELAFGPENLGLPAGEIRRRVADAATVIGLEDLITREPARLSGGQQQSVAMGSIWTMLPDILILDEPTSNLDPESSQRVLELVLMLNRDYGKTILLAEHKLDLVADIADQVVVLSKGEVILTGTPLEVFSQVETLLSMGMAPPQVTLLGYELRRRGAPIQRLPLTVEECGVTLSGLWSGS